MEAGGRALAALLCVVLLGGVAPGAPVLAAVPRAVATAVPAAAPASATPVPVRARALGARGLAALLPPLDPQSVRAVVTTGVRSSNGLKVAGPALPGPSAIDRWIRAARDRQRALPRAGVLRGLPGALPRRLSVSASQHAGGGRHPLSAGVGTSYGAGTGINPWWHYQEENVPGGGHVMINVGTGNWLLDVDDMAVAHKGIALAYRRTYNSQSGHDVLGTDGTPPSLWGNGWSSSWDAHLSGDGVRVVSVWDVDGARYDYTLGADGVSWQAPAGQHALLTSDGGCGFLWVKKSGTTYHFYSPAQLAGCSGTYASYAGFAGRIYQIVGRNRNTTLTFSYVWDNGNAGASGKIANVTAIAESGLQATVVMADYNGHRLAQSLNRPDGVAIYYSYDGNGNLTSVGRPPDNAGATRSYETYGYGAQGNGAGYMSWAASPRWAGSGATDGGYLYFGAEARGNTTLLLAVGHVGYVNPQLNDGVSSGVLQPGAATGSQQFQTESYDLETASASFSDSDGHLSTWQVDGLGRPLQTQECTASQNGQCTGTWLTSSQRWDAGNDLSATVDPRGYETDYAYDGNGNTIAVAQPSTASAQGTFRPTALYTYDGFDNVTAYCDPVATHGLGKDWSGAAPAAGGCPQSTAASQFVYAYPSGEPYGELQTTITPATAAAPSGYHEAYTYDPSRQGGTDYGLPTSVVGDAMTQTDGSSRQPRQDFWYTSNGWLGCYAKGSGTWVLAYDTDGQLTAVGDPDDASLSGSCSKTAGLSGSTIVTRKTYYSDGSLASAQTPAEAAANVSTAYSYDLDGNEQSETHHYGCTSSSSCTAGVTSKWYDGADRLVEVQQPTDAQDLYSFAWATRYLYDLTQNGTVGIANNQRTYQAHGNLYKTQEYLPNGTVTYGQGGTSGTGNPVWTDVSGTATDALDRPTQQLRSDGTNLQVISKTYDTSAGLGLLASSCNALSECTSYQYTPLDQPSTITFSLATTPTRTYTYDPDDRLATVSSSAGSVSESYDAAGHKLQRVQSIAGVATPATVAYHYYPDGLRSALDLTTTTTAANVLTDAYRADGRLQRLGFSYGAAAQWAFGYTAAGRLTSRSDNVLANAATTFAYDAYGRNTSFVFPGGTGESGLQFDPEGEPLSGYGTYSYGFSPGDTTTTNISGSYTSRGEAVLDFGDAMAAPHVHALPSLYANGYRVVTTASNGVSPGTSSATFNALLARPVSTTTGAQCDNPSPCTYGPVYTATTYAYDAVGRQSQVAGCVWNAPTPGECDGDALGYTKHYDAEDHLVQQAVTGAFTHKLSGYEFQMAYLWGPEGHPVRVGSTSITSDGNTTYPTDFAYESLFWDDDALLFTVNNSGTIDDIKIADLGDYAPSHVNGNSIVAWDADLKGHKLACHTSAGAGGAGETGTMSVAPNCPGLTPPIGNQASLVGQGQLLYSWRGDGYSDGYNNIQGVRMYDMNAGVWSTPDAYAGDVHDPMSQKPYMWNGNNPYEYSDPSGYCAEDACIIEGAAVGLGAEIIIGGSALIAGLAHIIGNDGAASTLSNFAHDSQGQINGVAAHVVNEARKYIPVGVRRRVRAEKGENCIHCGQDTVPQSRHPNSYELDHDIPVSRGGTDDPSNLNPSCRDCNRRKGAKTNEEFGTASNETK